MNPSNTSGSLRRNALGVSAITFFVVSAAAPLTAVAGGIPIAMLLGNGIGVPFSVVIVMAILLIFSMGYTAMARHVTNAGSFYAFTAQGLGGLAGGAVAYIAVLAYNAMQIGLYGLFGAVTAGTFQSLFGVALPWWVWSALGLIIVAVLGYRQIDLSAKVLAVLVAAEYVIVVIMDLTIIGHGGAGGLSMVSFTPHALMSGSTTIGLLICFACFMGFEATTIYSEEAHTPERTVPRATYLAVLIIGLFYAFTSWCMVNGTGADKLMKTLQSLSDPTTFIFTLSSKYTGSMATTIMELLLVSSVFAALLAFHNAAARYFYVLGREGLLPGDLGKTHDSHQSPHIGSGMQTLLGIVVLAVFAITKQDPVFALFTWLTNLATLSVITMMAIVSFSVFAFFSKSTQTSGVSTTRGIGAPIVAGLILAAIAIAVVMNFSVLTGASKTLAIGLPLLVPVAAILGIVSALMLKQKSQERFTKLGATQIGID